MIINTNEVILSDSNLPVQQTIIGAHTSTITNNNMESVKVGCQIGFFIDAQKMLESPTNALKVEGFGKDKRILNFDYPTDDRHVFYYFDVEVKAYLMKCFPEWDAEKLVITTTPTEEV